MDGSVRIYNMGHLIKAIRHAFKNYKCSIIGSIICSSIVGVLWGANIGAVYPFVEIVFEKQSLHQWAEREILQADEEIARLDFIITDLEKEINVAKDDLTKSDLKGKLLLEKSTVKSWKSRKSNILNFLPYIIKYAPESPFNTLVLFVVLLLSATILKGFFLSMSMVLGARASHGTVKDIQQAFFSKMLDLRLGVTKNSEIGDSASRLSGDIGSIGGALTLFIGKVIREPLKMVSCLALAAYVNWRLLILSLLICPLAALLLVKLARIIKQLSQAAFDIRAKNMGFMVQVMQAYHVVKAFGNEDFEKQRFNQKTDELYGKNMVIQFYSSMVRVNNEILGIGMICLSLIAGGYLVLNQETQIFGITLADKPMSTAEMMTFYALLIGCSDPIRKLGDVFGGIQGGVAGAERIYPMLEQIPSIIDPENPISLDGKDREICLENLNFSYSELQPVLHKINLTIKPGETIAIVGPNGCGKSTVVSLLLRFYDPRDGRITIGGVDIRDTTQADLRSRIGLVIQNTVLFNQSIMENIRYGDLEASDKQVIEAAKSALVDQFVDTHTTQGYRTMCGENGSNLSGGQRQRIAIARALIRNPDIIIMDEATSQIDLESERMIHASLRSCIQGRTAILITHRASTLELADRIVVMDHGNIEGIGTHEYLLKSSSTYQRLYQAEFIESQKDAA